MQLEHINIAYFLGIGGIGMSAIARYFRTLGIEVHGYDKTATALTDALASEGMLIHFEEDINAIPESIKAGNTNAIVIYTPAIPKDHAEFVWFQQAGTRLYKRAEVLGIISRNSFTIGVAGTHGKTTTSTLIAHLLHEAGINFTAFLGGISTNFNNNYVHVTDGISPLDKPIVVVEADEFDRSFLQLDPSVAIVTSTDADHLDIYGEASAVKQSFQDYINKTVTGGTAIIKEGLDLTFNGNVLRYGKSEQSNAFYHNVAVKDHKYIFDYTCHAERSRSIDSAHKHINTLTHQHIISGVPGFHNIENATAAITVGLLLGIDMHTLAKGVSTFRGVKRRFEYIIDTRDYVVIDDYAHHPAELKACIESVKYLYPHKTLTGIFQPHLFTRTRDFADGFATSLDLLDDCWLMEIYPAREKPIEGISAAFIAGKMQKPAAVLTRDEIKTRIRKNKPELLLILGAGDIDTIVQPIKHLYEESI